MLKFTAYELTAINLALSLAAPHCQTETARRYMQVLQQRTAQQIQRDTVYDGHTHVPPELEGE